MCLYPRLIANKKYQKTKKNGGIIPAVFDERTRVVPIKCGHCKECVKQKTREWQVRLNEEIRQNKNGRWMCLTFSNEEITKLYDEFRTEDCQGYDLDNKVAKVAIRRWYERHRKKYGKTIRHWFITELGQNNTEHIHMHGFIWNDKSNEEIEKLWKYGGIWWGEYVNEKTVNYSIKYIHKKDKIHKTYRSVIITSAGIGKGYTEREDAKRNAYKKDKTKETYKTRTGLTLSLPIYYRNKLYSEEERERLWIEKLDKQVRYINGHKIDISKDEKKYYKMLIQAQRDNEKEGYGNGYINWEEKQYEKQRRILKQKERLPRGGIHSVPLHVDNKESNSPDGVFRDMNVWDKEK